MTNTIQENKKLSELALNAYKTYQFKWLDEHGSSVFDTLEEMKEEGVADDKIDASNYDPQKLFEYLADSNGIRGELFVSFAEFKDNEFEDKEIVKNLLDDFDYEYYLQAAKPGEPGRILSYEPFGYEGTLCPVEGDIRHGIPMIDIVGLADNAVKESKERMLAGFRNQRIDFPQERVLISLSPVDVKKEAPHEVAIAMAILNQMSDSKLTEDCLVLGELKLDGTIEPVKTHALAAVERAKLFGISKVVCCEENVKDICNVDGIKIAVANNLTEIDDIVQGRKSFEYRHEPEIPQKSVLINGIEFNNSSESFLSENYKSLLESPGYSKAARTIQVAVAGRHNMFLAGSNKEKNSDFAETFFRYLTPNLTDEERREVEVIKSLTGEKQKPDAKNVVTIRRPFQTATIEGMCGGGSKVVPGEISRAHKGILLMEDANRFRLTIIEMLRIPLKNKELTISRAGRQSTFPTDFQLVMTQSDLGELDKTDLPWSRLKNLLNYVEVQDYLQQDKNDKSVFNLEKARIQIANAYSIQRKRGVFNHDLTPKQLSKYCLTDKNGKEFLSEISKSGNENAKNQIIQTMKVALTVANLDNREYVLEKDLKEAYKLQRPALEKKLAIEKKVEKSKSDDYLMSR